MTFLQIRPWVKVGAYLGEDLVTDNGVFKKGAKITQSMKELVNASSLIKLNVISNPDVKRELKKNKVQTYNAGNGKSTFLYYRGGDAGFSFKVKCLIRAMDTLNNGKTVFYHLNEYYSKHFAVSVVIDTEIVPNGIYIISDFTKFEPIRKDYYEVEIEFTQYQTVSSKLTNKCTVLQSYMKQCSKPSGKVYTAKQIKKGKAKTGPCYTYVNQVLKKKGCYTTSKGKYTAYKKYKSYITKYTTAALKRYGKKWNKQGLKPKVNEKGKLSKNMWTALKRYPEVK